MKLSVSFSQRQKTLKCLWSKYFELQKCGHTEKSNYGLNLSIISKFLTIYTVGKLQCDHSKEEQKLDRELKNKTIIISDSTLQKADENELNADIICVPGGKLGHLVNSLNYNEKILKYDNYVIVGGLNNVDNVLSKDTERSQVLKQLNELGRQRNLGW